MKKVISLLLIVINFLLMIPTYTFASEYYYPRNNEHVVIVEKSSGTSVSDVISVVKLALGAGILYVLYKAGIIGLLGSFAGLLAKGISGITNVGADIRAGKFPIFEDAKNAGGGIFVAGGGVSAVYAGLKQRWKNMIVSLGALVAGIAALAI